MGESGQRGEKSSPGRTGTVAESEPPGRLTLRDSLLTLTAQLASDDLDRRLEALGELARHGDAAAALLVDLLCRTPARSGQYPVIAEALERIGKPSVPALLSALTSIPAPRRADEIYLLQAAAEILGHLSDRRAVPALARILEVLQDAVDPPSNETLGVLGIAAKIRVHQALADLASREGAGDLLRMFGDGRRRVREELIDLAGRVGDRRFLPALVRLYGAELPVSEWRARLTKLAFREIARRERVERGDPAFARLDTASRELVDKLLPKAKNGNGRAHGRERDRHLRSA